MTNYYPRETGSPFAGRNLLNASRKTLEEGVDIALFGIPFNGGTRSLDGSRHAPDSLRQWSRNIRDFNLATKVAPFELCRIADIGDAPVDPTNAELSLQQITDYCHQVCASGALPIAVGGDHLIALPMLRALAAQHGPLAIVHIDAHTDTINEFTDQQGFIRRYNSGTIFRRAVEEGLEHPDKHMMMGIRGTFIHQPEYMETYQWSEQQGMHMLWIEQCDQLGAEGIVKKIREVIGDLPFYLTIDVDGLDPTEMPGTGSPEPCGIKLRDMFTILRGLRGMNLVGADINEVNPMLDPTGMTAFHAAHLLFDIVCLAAEVKAG